MKKLTIREVNARRPRCKRCVCTADFAWLDDPAARRDLYKHVVDSGTSLLFMKALWQEAGGRITNAKATFIHLVKPKGNCHRCDRNLGELPTGTIVDCPKCHSVNIKW